eukprot:m.81972 g.81972  ORF g.81972 m.81972 type:complete len:75 (+) comp36275_c0_seq3:217-441(+)
MRPSKFSGIWTFFEGVFVMFNSSPPKVTQNVALEDLALSVHWKFYSRSISTVKRLLCPRMSYAWQWLRRLLYDS